MRNLVPWWSNLGPRFRFRSVCVVCVVLAEWCERAVQRAVQCSVVHCRAVIRVQWCWSCECSAARSALHSALHCLWALCGPPSVPAASRWLADGWRSELSCSTRSIDCFIRCPAPAADQLAQSLRWSGTRRCTHAGRRHSCRGIAIDAHAAVIVRDQPNAIRTASHIRQRHNRSFTLQPHSTHQH